jgi:hypothetical protein
MLHVMRSPLSSKVTTPLPAEVTDPPSAAAFRFAMYLLLLGPVESSQLTAITAIAAAPTIPAANLTVLRM